MTKATDQHLLKCWDDLSEQASDLLTASIAGLHGDARAVLFLASHVITAPTGATAIVVEVAPELAQWLLAEAKKCPSAPASQ